MEWKLVNFTLCIAFIILPTVGSVTCRWAESIWSEGACFQYNSTNLSYPDAMDACHSKGGVLATVKTRTQLNESTKTVPDDRAIWFGANDIEKEGTWVWVDDGTVATELDLLWFSKFNQPFNDTDKQCCAIGITPSKETGIFNWNCTTKIGFLCMEKELHTTVDTTTSTSTTNDPATTTTADTTTSTSTTNDSATTLPADTTTSKSTTYDTATTTNANTRTSTSTTNSPATTTTTDTMTSTSTRNNPAATTTTDTLTSTSTTNDPAITTTAFSTTGAGATTLACGANLIDKNILLLINVFSFNYLITYTFFK